MSAAFPRLGSRREPRCSGLRSLSQAARQPGRSRRDWTFGASGHVELSKDDGRGRCLRGGSYGVPEAATKAKAAGRGGEGVAMRHSSPKALPLSTVVFPSPNTPSQATVRGEARRRQGEEVIRGTFDDF